MALAFRVVARRTLFTINILVAVLFLLSCLAPYVNPARGWFISFMGLGFPFLLFFQVIFFFSWLIFKPRFALLPFITLLFGFKSIIVFFGFNAPSSFSYKKKEGEIRIASWNVARFLEWKRNNSERSKTRLRMLEQIQKQDADIICLQEFFHSPDTVFYDNIAEIQAFGYPHYYFSYDPDGDKQFIGSIIFSRYPFIDTGLVRYFRPSMPEALIHADIRVGNDTVRVFTTHLQSVQFRQREFEAIDEIKSAQDSLLANSRTVLSKIRSAMRYRSSQADVVRQILDDSPFPTVFCGDLNDIPNSYTYFTIRGNMQDAFLEKGFGIGRTYSSLAPTLRIDYVFGDERIGFRQFTRVVKNLSDHYLLLTDLRVLPVPVPGK